MRNITARAVDALFTKSDFKLSNTRVDVRNRVATMYLHGNAIAEYDGAFLRVSDAGWQTHTTKERLNGVLRRVNWYISTHAGQWLISQIGGRVYSFEPWFTIRPFSGLTERVTPAVKGQHYIDQRGRVVLARGTNKEQCSVCCYCDELGKCTARGKEPLHDNVLVTCDIGVRFIEVKG